MSAAPPKFALQAVPGWRHEAPAAGCRWVLARAGLAATVWRVETPAGVFLLKHRPCAAVERELGADVRAGLALQRIAHDAGLAPAVVAEDAAGRFDVHEFLAGSCWTRSQLRSEQGARRLGTALRRLQALPVPTGLDAGPTLAERVERLVRQAAHLQPAHAAGLQQLLSANERDLHLVRSAGRPGVIVHSDLHPGNLLEPVPVAAGPVLIDWDYAHFGDPLEDLAALRARMPAGAGSVDMYLQALGLAGQARSAELDALTRTYRRLTYLWLRLWRRRRHAGAHGLRSAN